MLLLTCYFTTFFTPQPIFLRRSMDVPFRVKRYRGTQPADPRPKAVCSAPVHSRELAPNRIDGLSMISSVRPQMNFVSPNPLPAPTILPRRSQVFRAYEPPPAPSFISSRRSQPYPSSCEQELSADASTPLRPHPLPSVFSPLRGSQSSRTRSSPQSASQQHVGSTGGVSPARNMWSGFFGFGGGWAGGQFHPGYDSRTSSTYFIGPPGSL